MPVSSAVLVVFMIVVAIDFLFLSFAPRGLLLKHQRDRQTEFIYADQEPNTTPSVTEIPKEALNA